MISARKISFAHAVPIERIINERGIKLDGKVERVGPCPICGGTDRFGIDVRKQMFNCRGCCVGGDVIKLVEFLDGCSFLDAVATLAGELPGNAINNKPVDIARQHVERELREVKASADECRRLHRAAHIWDESVAIGGTPGEAYLTKRGIVLDELPEHGGLRWHPACPWENSTAECIISRFTDAVTGEPRGIHRRPISGEKPKTLGPMAGSVIRLWSDADVAEGLVIGEGLETTLAAATRITHRGTLLRPAWATGSAGNLADFPVLSGIEALTILVDNDESGAGQRAAEQCARRWRNAGREVIRLMPGHLGADFNDLVKR